MMAALPLDVAPGSASSAFVTAPQITQKAADERQVLVKASGFEDTSTVMQLTVWDKMSGGRSTPMVWYFDKKLDPDAMIAALERTLVDYPVLAGRYVAPGFGGVLLNNAGVLVIVCSAPDTTLAQALGYMPAAAKDTREATFFNSKVNEAFLPQKSPMDPDKGDPNLPICAIKITAFPNDSGTAVGLLCQHAVLDGESEVAFMKNWSQQFRNVSYEPSPCHDRCCIENDIQVDDVELDAQGKPQDATSARLKVIPPGQQYVPEFAAIMPRIIGPQTVCVPLSKALLQRLKAEASHGLSEGQFVSTDDVASAHTWRALAKTRCAQLGIDTNSDTITTTISRACNYRSRTKPPLGAGYIGNGVSQLATTMSVKELTTLPISAVAAQLRSDLLAQTPGHIAARTKFVKQTLETGASAKFVYDKQGLTFIVSSWMFDWEGVDFGAVPVCFDHGAHVPIVSVFTPRAQGDGIHVYHSGTLEAMQMFVGFLTGGAEAVSERGA
eukprot:TRINITY_DN48406_c0_g1_i1.p1 TRINITY_DN48406_c0_g1~~TRINITY_DN48406_c0_g1_i1.p1  ORF type:complete len:546 (+),score=104.06 TRINITY_DN48406_c0_g1_i1:148-1638(+)